VVVLSQNNENRTEEAEVKADVDEKKMLEKKYCLIMRIVGIVIIITSIVFMILNGIKGLNSTSLLLGVFITSAFGMR